MSAVGVAFGINRILSELRKIEDENEEIANSVVFAKSGCDADTYIFAKNLRVSGFCCEQYIDGYDEKEAEKYAEKVGAPYFFKVGEDDYLSVKNLISGDYVETTVEDFLENFE